LGGRRWPEPWLSSQGRGALYGCWALEEGATGFQQWVVLHGRVFFRWLGRVDVVFFEEADGW